MNVRQQRVLGMYLDRIDMIDAQLHTADEEIAAAMSEHYEVVARLAEVPGLGPDSALAILAEVGPEAATFDSPQELASWVGVCPGDNVSAENNNSSRCAKGNVYLRRLLDQAAQAAARKKGSVFEAKLRRLKPKLGYQGAVWAVAHKLLRLIWKILRQKVRYIEYGEQGDPKAQRRRMQRMAHRLQAFGSTVLPPAAPPQLEPA